MSKSDKSPLDTIRDVMTDSGHSSALGPSKPCLCKAKCGRNSAEILCRAHPESRLIATLTDFLTVGLTCPVCEQDVVAVKSSAALELVPNPQLTDRAKAAEYKALIAPAGDHAEDITN